MSSYTELYIKEDIQDKFSDELYEVFGDDYLLDTTEIFGVTEIMEINVINIDDDILGSIKVKSLPILSNNDYFFVPIDWEVCELLEINKF
jgi:hypothetical protein